MEWKALPNCSESHLFFAEQTEDPPFWVDLDSSCELPKVETEVIVGVQFFERAKVQGQQNFEALRDWVAMETRLEKIDAA